MKKNFVVSDVHGFYTILMESLKEKGFEIDNNDHHIIVCGDLFDRGLEAKQLLEFVENMISQNRLIYIRGNHEDLFLDCLDEFLSFKSLNPIHFHNGTSGTLNQLGKDVFRLKKIINNNCIDYFNLGNYIFVHGWIPHNYNRNMDLFEFNPNWRKASKSDWESARWLNGMLAAHHKIIEEGKTIVCGHWHTGYGHYNYHNVGDDEYSCCDVYRDNGIIAIDSCVAYSKKLNVLVFDENGNEVI